MHGHATQNKIFRLVWNQARQAWVAVAETARGRGGKAARRAAASLLLLLGATHALAGPTGGQVTSGSAAISQSGAVTTINQSSASAVLNWQSFNTSAQETVRFVQPSAQAIAVNRIADTSATQFFGRLDANGQVWLINPNGVLFGAGSQVNVGGLVASTLDLAADGSTRFAGSGAGALVNEGSITAAAGGYVALLGNSVRNSGSISAAQGTVALAAGSDISLTFAQNRLLSVKVNQSTLDNLAENGGLINADGGRVLLSAGARDAVLASAVNNTGIVEARSVQNVNGSIVLDGGGAGSATNSGTLDASGLGAGQTGGTVHVLSGNAVNLTAGSLIDVRGDAGGGTALVGGNFQGGGIEQHALAANVAAGATIKADAINSGNGGTAVVWSDGRTQFDGSISARGGASAGNGGQVETSGHELNIGNSASVNTLASAGTAGEWLLDPMDLRIYAPGSGSGDVSTDQISAALQSGNVTIKTGANSNSCSVSCSGGTAGSGDIVIASLSGIGIGWTTGTTLTLSAYRDIHFESDAYIDATQGPGNIVLRADNSAQGTGTIRFDSMFSGGVATGNGSITVSYTPSSYFSPTDFSSNIFSNGGGQVQIKMNINLAGTVSTKTYDGNDSATIVGLSPVSVPSGITVNTAGANATFSDKNAGTNKAVTITGVSMSGAGAANYFLNGLESKTGTISKANLTVSGSLTANGKPYDGNTSTTVSGTPSVTPISGDSVSVAFASANFSDKNVGANKAVTAIYALSGTDAGNYNLIQPTGLSATISKADLAVTGITAANKTYDATTSATLSGTASVSAISGDTVTLGGTGVGTFANKNVGSGKAVTVTGYTLSGADAGNYNLIQPTGLTATINQADLSLTGLTAQNKVYDRTTGATLSGTAAVSALGADSVTVTGTGIASFADKNAGSGKPVSVSGYSLTGTDAGNYNLQMPVGLTANITSAQLSISGVSAADKVYDGSASAVLGGTATVSALAGDSVTLTGTGVGTFANKNAGNGKSVSVTGYTLSGTDAANYTLVPPAGLTATISKADLLLTGLSAASKTYDATTVATLSGTASVTAIGGDVVSLSGTGTGTFADKNVGSGKSVTVSGYTLSGTDAGNYNLVAPSNLTASISKATVTVGGISAADKVYDATTTAQITGTATVAALAGDSVSVSGSGVGSFADKNVGSGKSVTVGGFTLSGADAGNYDLVQPTGLSASISKADLAVTGLSASDKVYDTTTSATLAGTASVTALGSDSVTLGGTAVGSFADKNAGQNKAIVVGGLTLSGADAGNYTLVAPASLTATISKAELVLAGLSAVDKVYDASTTTLLSGTASFTALSGDAVSLGGTGVGVFSDKNVGSNKAVAIGGYTLSGADAGNYTLTTPGLTASITPATITVSGLGVANKVYDASTLATLTGTATVAALGSDSLSLGGAGHAEFADKNAGASKAVTVSGYTLAGADAGNYVLQQPAGLTASIAKADLAVSGLSAVGKTYDSSTVATLAGTAGVMALAADQVTLSGAAAGRFSDKNVGQGKAVSVSGLSLAGADAGNYTLIEPTGLTASITPATLQVGGLSAANKVYDATTAAVLNGTASVTALGSDVVSVAGTGVGTFADKNVGAGKAVTVGGYTLTGADAGNYLIAQPSGLTANIGQAQLVVSGITAADKLFDGSTSATVSTAGAVLRGLLAGDQVSVSATGAFADASVGTAKTLTLSSSYSGADVGNYAIVSQASTTASINAVPTEVPPPVVTPPVVVPPVVPPTVPPAQQILLDNVLPSLVGTAISPPLAGGLASVIVVDQPRNPSLTSSFYGAGTALTAQPLQLIAPQIDGTPPQVNTLLNPRVTLQIQNGGMRLPTLVRNGE